MDISKPGTAILIYSDDGPKGPCGQAMSITCPHTAIHVFSSEDNMRDFLEGNPNWSRNGKRAQVRMLVVGEGQTLGTSLKIHD